MALTHYYVDPSAGNDTTGDGSIGTPWKTTQKVLNTITRGADGDQINIKDTAADVLTAALDFTLYGVSSGTAQLIFSGYTSVANDGGIGEIDGAGTYAIVNETARDWTNFQYMKLGNCGTEPIVYMDKDGGLNSCILYGSSHLTPVRINTGWFINCYLHSWTNAATTGFFLYTNADAHVHGNFVDTGTVDCSGGMRINSATSCVGNIVKCNNVGAVGIYLNNYDCFVVGNSVFNAAAGTEGGIWSSGVNLPGCAILDNAVEGWSGTGGAGVKFTNSSSYRIPALANNIFYNNATNISISGDTPMIEIGNISAVASPFADAANGDFTMSTEGKAKTYMYSMGDGTTINYKDVGAAQRVEGAGGGGGLTSQAYFS